MVVISLDRGFKLFPLDEEPNFVKIRIFKSVIREIGGTKPLNLLFGDFFPLEKVKTVNFLVQTLNEEFEIYIDNKLSDMFLVYNYLYLKRHHSCSLEIKISFLILSFLQCISTNFMGSLALFTTTYADPVNLRLFITNKSSLRSLFIVLYIGRYSLFGHAPTFTND